MKTIEVIIDLKDQLTKNLDSTVGKANAQLKRLQNQIQDTKHSLVRDTNLGMEKLSINTSQISNAVSGIAIGVTAAGVALIGAITNIVGEAQKVRNQQLNMASTNRSLLGVDWETAKKYATAQRQQLFDASIDTPVRKESLDGFAASGMDTLIGGKAIDKLTGNFTQLGLDLVRRTAVLSEAAGTNAAQAGRAFSEFVDMGKTSSFNTDQFFTENTTFTNSLKDLDKALQKSGKMLKDLKPEERLKLWSEALTKSVPTEFIAEKSRGLENQLGNAIDSLLDPEQGVFGALRKVKDRFGNSTTVLDQMGLLFSALQNLSGSVGKALGKLGFTLDPMQTLVTSIESFTAAINSFTFPTLDASGLYGIGQSIANGLSSVAQSITNWFAESGIYIVANGAAGIGIVLTGFLAQLGNNLSDWLNSQLIEAWNLFVSNTMAEFSALGQLATGLADKINGAVSGLFSSISSAIQSAISSIPGLSRITGSISQPVNRYAGQNLHWLNAYRGMNLDRAIKTELFNAPPGAKPVIANSSELIVPRDKLHLLGNKSGDFNLTLQINTKVEQIHQEVNKALDYYFGTLSMT